MPRCIGDIHVPLGAIPELVAFIAQDGSGRPDRLGTDLLEAGKLQSLTVDDFAAVDDMEEIPGMGRSSAFRRELTDLSVADAWMTMPVIIANDLGLALFRSALG